MAGMPVCLLAVLTWMFMLHSAAGVNETRLARQAASVKDDQLDPSTLIWEMLHPWETYLTPGPVAISLMGQLLVLSSRTDFALNVYDPQKQFVHIRYPTSFRATLVQLVNEAWEAFHEGFRAMDYVQLQMQQIPVHVRTVVRTLRQAPPSFMVRMLNIPLEIIRESSVRCIAKANATETKFAKIVLLTAEIGESLEAGRGHYERLLGNNDIQLAENARIRAGIEEEVGALNTQLHEINEAVYPNGSELVALMVRRESEDFRQALKDLPTGLKAAIQNVVHAVAGRIRGGGRNDNPGPQTSPNKVQVKTPSGLEKKIAERALDITSEIKDRLDLLLSSNNSENHKQFFQAKSVALKALAHSLSADAEYADLRQNIDAAQALCANIQATIETNKSTSQWKDEANRLRKSFEHSYVRLGAELSEPGVENVPVSSYQGPHANEQMKVQFTHAKAMQSQQIQLKVFQMRMKSMDKLHKLLAQIARMDIEKIQYEELLQLIREAVSLLSSLKREWSLLTQFFTKISSRVETIVSVSILSYVRTVQAATALGLGTSRDEMAEVKTYAIAEAAGNARGILASANYLQALSGMCVEIHSVHFNTQLAGLSSLTTLRPEQQQEAIRNLLRTAESAEDDIKHRVLRRKQEYQATIAQRIASSEAELRRLGQISAETEAFPKLE